VRQREHAPALAASGGAALTLGGATGLAAFNRGNGLADEAEPAGDEGF